MVAGALKVNVRIKRLKLILFMRTLQGCNYRIRRTVKGTIFRLLRTSTCSSSSLSHDGFTVSKCCKSESDLLPRPEGTNEKEKSVDYFSVFTLLSAFAYKTLTSCFSLVCLFPIPSDVTLLAPCCNPAPMSMHNASCVIGHELWF